MHSYLLFHSLAELTAATVSFATFMFAWNTRRFQNAYLLTVGAAALFVGAYEALHCLAFPGMQVFVGFDDNLSPQLWLAARVLQVSASLVGLLLPNRPVRAPSLLAAFGGLFAVGCLAIFSGQVPAVVQLPSGLPPFKVATEWTLVGAFLTFVVLLFRVRDRFSFRVFWLLVAHGLTMAACEICFTLYARPYDPSNLLGHILLLTGAPLQYLAILRAGLIDPSETHFRDLTRIRDRLERAQAAGRIGTFEWDLASGVSIAGMESVYGDHSPPPGDMSAWRDRIHPEDRDRVARDLDVVLAQRTDYDTEYRVTWPDGSTRWVAARGRLQTDNHGRPFRLVGVNMDITERKRVEQALRESEQQYRQEREQAERRAAELDAILDSLAEPLVVSDAHGKVVRVNPAFRRLIGPIESWQGLDIADRLKLVQAESADGSALEPQQTPESRALAGETVHGVLQRWHLRSGTVMHLATSSAPIRTATGIVGAVVIFTDVSERVRAEQALREMDQRKNEFMAVLSHELRNPLAPIQNSLHILGRVAPESEQAQRALAVIRRQVGQLSRLVDDLLDLTRISRNKIHLQRERAELNDLVRRTVEDYHTLFDGKDVRVHFHPTMSPVFAHVDANRLAQAVGNLLQNALKFTPTGGQVDVSVILSPGAKQVDIRVADNGTGLTAEVLPRLFQPFVQADETLERSKGGLGLGLALVKGVIELHEGHVCACSEGLGKGAEFVLTLPLGEAAANQTLADSKKAHNRPKRVLIIEDNVDAADTLCEVLRFEGHEVTVAYDGRKGIERAREIGPDVILCDIGLPGMDGYEVARSLRANATLCGTRLVALSGYALPEDLRRATEAGFDAHLAKPPSFEKLTMLLAEVTASTDVTRLGVGNSRA